MAQCIVQQYNNFTIKELNLSVNGILTQVKPAKKSAIYLASQEAPEVMLVTLSNTEWVSEWLRVSIHLTDETLVS